MLDITVKEDRTYREAVYQYVEYNCPRSLTEEQVRSCITSSKPIHDCPDCHYK
jgi:hypothetical protein